VHFVLRGKKTQVNKTHQLITGISTAILGVMEPHWKEGKKSFKSETNSDSDFAEKIFFFAGSHF
jgi:hypothetical protein